MGNKKSSDRNIESTKCRIVIDNISVEEFGELLRAKERVKELDSTKAFAEATYEDYKRLYATCLELIESYKNQHNIEAAFDKLDTELTEHFPCPF